MVISIETMTVDCAVRHIRTLFYQCSEDRKADFGETCSQCPHMLECNCDWINTLDPLLRRTTTTEEFTPAVKKQNDKSAK